MLSETLRRILSLSPKGRTTLQLVRLLEQASIKSNRAEVLSALDEMRRRRLISIDRGRHWHMRSLHAGSQLPNDPPLPDHEDSGASAPLHAVRARIRDVPETLEDDEFKDMVDMSRPPPFGQLLSYYGATQRSDPRGSISQFPDRHEHQFQMFHGVGQWWSRSSKLTIELGDLPPTFREALSKREGDALAIGYPLAILVKDGIKGIFPVGLISASATRAEGILEITPQSADVVLNPDWIRQAGRSTGWSTKALTEQLDAPEGLAFDDFRERLSECMATQLLGRLLPDSLVGSIAPGRIGIHNAAAIFLPMETSFTKGTANDLRKLAEAPASRLKGTALWSLLHDSAMEGSLGLVLNPVPLTPNQLEAAELAITGPITAVTGPPGTGKTQVIVSVIATALAKGKTVLFASRNHQAIDAVEERLAALSLKQSIVVRTNDREGERNTDFVRIIAEVADDDTQATADTIGGNLDRLRKKAEVRSTAFRNRAELQRLHCRLSEHVERRGEVLARTKRGSRRAESLLIRLLRFLRFWRTAPSTEILAPGATLAELDVAIERDRKELARIATAGDTIFYNEEIAEGMAKLFPALVANALAVGAEDRQRLNAEQKELEFLGRAKARDLSEHVARLVLTCRPVWAVSTLSVPSRVPLVLGLFDYVIFDEASQCDIASALPLMARAKRAVIVGDPNQLESIPGLGLAQERALMKAVGLPLRGMGQYAQSRNSLFGFSASRPGTRTVMLRDQFRSATDIVDYLNDAFYDGRLRATRDLTDLKVPSGVKAGLAWTDVEGRVSLDQAGQPQNREEVKAIVEHLGSLLREHNYQGTIGVIAPFNAQVALLKQQIDNDISRELQERAELKVSTVDKFQGGERDVILLSTVAAPGLTQGARTFLVRDKRRFNVAISRARAVAHVFGNLSFARESGVRHLAILADRATNPRVRTNPEDIFDSMWERRVDAALRARGLKATPQYPIAGRYLDFALFGAGDIKLDLEVDGRQWHMDPDGKRKVGDIWRDHQLKSLGWRVRRFWVHELEQDMEGCLDQVERDLAR